MLSWRLHSLRRNIEARCQRFIRGYAEEDWWDLDLFLAHLLPILLRKRKENAHSRPRKTTSKEWANILEKIAQGFDEAALIKDVGDGDIDKFNEAMDLLKEHFFSLWD